MASGIFGIIAPHPPIMVPAVGGADADVTRASADSMEVAARLLASYDPDTVVVMSPHSPAVAGSFAIDTAARTSGSLGQFGAAQTAITCQGDPALAAALLERLERRGISAVDRASNAALRSGELDHGVVVPMSFLDPAGRWPLLVLSLSYLPLGTHVALGEELASAADDLGRRIAFVASGDCSHRLTHDAPAGYSLRGAELDATLVELIGASDFDGLTHIDPGLAEAGGECGLRSFVTLGGVARPAHARVLSYEGPWGVGYLTAIVNEEAVTAESGAKHGAAGFDESEIVVLARAAIEAFVRTREVLEPDPLVDPVFPPRAGAFVSLHRGGALRGCIGTIAPTRDTLAEEVVNNAVEAATRDPRFPPLTIPELDALDIKVDVLHEPEKCEFEDLHPRDYGVIVTDGFRRGLLLPDLEGVDTPDQQVDIACHKAGISPHERISLERFKVDRYA
ncbi:MAG: AmmeMemoRadiSam system protein A [Actinomycetota bacterium]|nr:AmmeMemoRadiSam system protein A [Actinomycetota bacterium]